MSDDQESFLKNRVIFLNSLSNLLPQNPATSALRSHYLTKSRWLTSQSGVDLPRKIKNDSCPRCCVLYKDAPVLHRIEAAKRKNRFQRRLLQNTESVNTRFQKDYLTSLQSKNATNVHNFLVRTCGVCGHDAKKVLQKPAVEALEESFEIRTLTSKPKKKKKDRFSGLNVSAVLSVTPQLKTPQNVTKETPRKTTPKILLNKSQIRKKKEDNKKKLRGLKNIFNDSSKSTPANSLKNFLSSL